MLKHRLEMKSNHDAIKIMILQTLGKGKAFTATAGAPLKETLTLIFGAEG